MRACVRACVLACVRACVRACVCVCVCACVRECAAIPVFGHKKILQTLVGMGSATLAGAVP